MDELLRTFLAILLYVSLPAAVLGGLGAGMGWLLKRTAAYAATWSVLSVGAGLTGWGVYLAWIAYNDSTTSDWGQLLVLWMFFLYMLLVLVTTTVAGAGAFFGSLRGLGGAVTGGALGAGAGSVFGFAALFLLLWLR